MSMIRRLRESITGQKPKSSNILIVSPVKQDWGVAPPVNFSTIKDVIVKEPIFFATVSHMTSEIARPFTIFTDESYSIRVNGMSAREYLEEYARSVNLDGVVSTVAFELVGFGNSFLRVRSDGSVEVIPLLAVDRVVPVNSVTPIHVKYQLKLKSTYGGAVLKPDEFIHFRVFTLFDDIFGHTFIESALSTTNPDAPTLLQMKEKLKIAMTNLALKAGAPTEYITGNLTEEEQRAIAEALTNIPFWGRRIVLGKEVQVTSSLLPRAQMVDQWTQLIETEMFVLCGDPILRLSSFPGFTEASSRTAEAMHQKRIDYYQRVIKRGIEQLLYSVLAKTSFDPSRVKPRVEFQNLMETVPGKSVAVPRYERVTVPVSESASQGTVDVNVNLKTEPIRTEPLHAEPVKVVVESRSEPVKVDLTVKQDQNIALEQERLRLLKELSKKVR